jgi:CheY-like chemotaxis protein
MINLATNARDAMPKGGRITITSELAKIDESFIQSHGYGEPGRYALVTIADTGTGMDSTTVEKIFEPFFTTKELGRGTGLGLAIAYGIVKQHNGYINVSSEPGKGTTFNIYIPVTTTGKRTGESTAPLPSSPLHGGTETILLAEDDEALKKLTGTVLKTYGYRMIVAEDGEDAVRKFLEHKDQVQLVILDMIMPKKSGKEAYDEIRKINPAIKTLFVSGYTADKIQKEGVIEEGIELMLKPVSPRDLLRKVRAVLDR